MTCHKTLCMLGLYEINYFLYILFNRIFNMKLTRVHRLECSRGNIRNCITAPRRSLSRWPVPIETAISPSDNLVSSSDRVPTICTIIDRDLSIVTERILKRGERELFVLSLVIFSPLLSSKCYKLTYSEEAK